MDDFNKLELCFSTDRLKKKTKVKLRDSLRSSLERERKKQVVDDKKFD